MVHVSGEAILVFFVLSITTVALVTLLVVKNESGTLPIRSASYQSRYRIYGRTDSRLTLPQDGGLLVAFLGDSGVGQHFLDVLNLIKEEGADLVLHQGDMAYHESPWTWDNAISSILGSKFPYVAVAGNHDVARWGEYRALISTRLERSGLSESCSGIPGENLVCSFGGLAWYQSDIGTFHPKSVNWTFPTELFAAAPWKVCSWHKNAHQVRARVCRAFSHSFSSCRSERNDSRCLGLHTTRAQRLAP